MTLPVGGGLLYVQPVYVQSTGDTSYPLLQKVLTAFGQKIAFEGTLTQSLDVLFGGDSGAVAGDTNVPTNAAPSSPPDNAAQSSTNPALRSALNDAKQAAADGDAALKSGNWAAYGAAVDRLNKAIAAAVAAESPGAGG